jgi:hypothetical protein
MKTYICKFERSYGWGNCSDERTFIIGATAQSEALGRALMLESDSVACEWDITEFDPEKSEPEQVHYRSS